MLGYPKFRLSPELQVSLVASEVLPFRDRHEVPSGPAVCRDAADDPFLWCARAAYADALVTGDDDLLALGDSWEGVRIVRLAEILEILAGRNRTPPAPEGEIG